MNPFRKSAIALAPKVFIRTVLLPFALSSAVFVGQIAPVAVAPVALTALVVTQTACPKISKEDAVFWGEQAHSAFTDVIPILVSNGQNVEKAKHAAAITRRLIDAIKANDGTAIGHAATVIRLLQEIANDVKLIPDQGKRTTILVILAIANVALNRIAASLPDKNDAVSSRGSASDIETIKTFAKKKVWRCRDSVSDQFRKMEFCKLNPATSTVETY